ncbi:MAG: hypothetical protein ACT4OY_07315 [Alphaproteobacteria bacterium]
MSFRICLPFIALAALTVLPSCAYMMDDSIQDLTVETPGAEDATCHVYVEKLHYRFKPPQTRSISKSKQDLIVDCLAPGNRHQKVVVEAEIEKSTGYNVFNGVVIGVAWDHLSAALYKYPSIIKVDFTNAPILPEDMPDQNNPDIRQPEDYQLEEYRASVPRLNSDSAYDGGTGELKRREPPAIQKTTSTYTDTPPPAPSGPASDKGDLMPASQQPVPLYPGQ